MSKTLKILSRPQGNAEEYGRWAVNPYKGCSHGCLYCYLKKGVWAKGLGGDTAQLKAGVVNEDHAYHLAMAEIIEHREEIIRDGGLFMTFTSDPMVSKTLDLFLSIIYDCVRGDLTPVTVLTKAAGFWDCYRVWRICEAMQGRKDVPVAFGWTLTGHDELEPNAPTNEERIMEMKLMRSYFKTWASIEPVIDFPSALAMVWQAVNGGCKHLKIGLLTSNTRLVTKDFAFGEHHFDAYKVSDCLHFIEDVMRLTDGRATVYWKQSVRDLLGTVYSPAAVDELLDWPHSVDKDWNMFK